MAESSDKKRQLMVNAALIIALVSLGLIALNPLLAWIAVLSMLLLFFAPAQDTSRKAKSRLAVALSCLAITIGFLFFLVTEAVPGIIEGGRRAAGKTALSTLRTVYWGQNMFRQGRHIDANNNGIPEFGFFGELTGVSPLRTTGEKIPDLILRPRAFQLASGNLAGVAVNGPYCYVIYLPGKKGVATEDENGVVHTRFVDASLAEKHWVAYAWPLELGKTSDSVYFINQNEEIFVSDNQGSQQLYTGFQHMPDWDAAPLPEGLTASPLGEKGGDGGVWTRWRDKKPKPLPQLPKK